MSEFLNIPLPWPTLLVLTAVSFISSLLTAAIGAGGGTVMLAALAVVLPGMDIVPVHSAVQFGSNAGRAYMARRHIDWSIQRLVLAGAVIGTLAAAPLLVYVLTPELIELLIAVFILVSLWLPTPVLGLRDRRFIVLFGVVVSFVGVFVSAVGPMVSTYIKRLGVDRMTLIATMAASLLGIIVVRILVFSGAGVQWHGWLTLIAVLIVAGLAGTRVGLMLLGRMPERLFQSILKFLLTALALKLLWGALAAL